MSSLDHTMILGFRPISPVANVVLSGCLAMHSTSSVFPSAMSSLSGLSVMCFCVS